jgi:alcohol dehydrogenase class IV
VTQKVLFGVGSVERVRPQLNLLAASRIFLVTGQDSFATSGAAAALAPALCSRSAYRYSQFTANPKLEDVETGVALLRSDRYDAVVAVGGGSVLDMAKLINVLARQQTEPADAVIRRTAIAAPGLPLVAVPTTAGSGSEATHFAVVYVDRVKHSVASPFLLPDTAIIDPALTFTLSPALTAVTGMDAFAQAVESYWCIHATDASRRDAARAITLVLEHLECAVKAPTRRSRRAMSKAAYLAGRAINVTKTTGAHAVSYPLTAFFGLPHGHAVCLTLGQFLVYNSEVTDQDVVDARGAEYVRRSIGELVQMLACSNAEQARARIERLMESVRLATRLSSLGIACRDAVDAIAANVNAERLANNPRALNHESLRHLVEAIC